LYNPTGNTVKTLHKFTVRWFADARAEGGLMGLALDPGFDTNRYLYVYNSETVDTATARRVVARYTLNANDSIVAGSKKELLAFPYPNYDAHHPGADLIFDKNGNLYIGTGDDTFNDASDGYSPTDERPNRVHYDAQKSAASTKSFSGKILRIHPEADGTYSIPTGNLFTDTSKGLKEIYIMGCRNPFSLTIDSKTNTLYWGEPGPNSSVSSATRGPRGYDEVNKATEAGNYGWPYFNGPNYAYTKYNFADSTVGAKWDSLKPVNTSPNHKGLDTLPPAKGAMVWYSFNNSREQVADYSREPAWPEFGQGRSNAVILGPIYRYDTALVSPYKLPKSFDSTLFVGDWGRSFIKTVKLNGDGNPSRVDPFKDPGLEEPQVELDSAGNFLKFFFAPSPINNPMDMAQGPDGTLYILAWGEWNYPHNTNNGTLLRLEMAVPTGLHHTAPYHRRQLNSDGMVATLGKSQVVELPEGIKGFEVYSMNGSKVWTYSRVDASRHDIVRIPGSLPSGLLKLRLLK
jgi:cytochrome c